MPTAPRRLLRVLTIFALGAAMAAPEAPADPERARRLSVLEDEMKRLQGEMNGLSAREQTVMTEVGRMDAELAMRRAQLESLSLREKTARERLAAIAGDMSRIGADQARRLPRLNARVREIYKRGPAEVLKRVLSPAAGPDALDGLRYASYLSRRDARQLAEYRASAAALSGEREALGQEREHLDALRSQAASEEARLASGRAARASLLDRIRGDQKQHEKALDELQDAARNLGRVVESVGEQPGPTPLDVRKFRGLLDWPADGPVSARFGNVIHPKFRTEVPHPGLDIDAPEGRPFRTIFDGRVAFAAPLSGYGLTVVIDHGNGVVSVYAHAGVLIVESGEHVARGQELGRVGDSGSLRGPYLYFEIREGGRPVDPAAWLRHR